MIFKSPVRKNTIDALVPNTFADKEVLFQGVKI